MKFRRKLAKCYVCSIALYEPEIWTLKKNRKEISRELRNVGLGNRTYKASNEDVVRRVDEVRSKPDCYSYSND